MKQFETEHYLFHYGENTKAEADIREIAACQESCLYYICQVLRTKPPFKIEYYLCDSPEEVGRVYGDDEPCNAFAALPDKIYAVYNERIQCIGFHEDAHIVSYCINRPDSPAIREGLAMYFDRQWWGISNWTWAAYYQKTGRCPDVDKLLERERFFSLDCSITYPVMGAFTDYLISTYGMEDYLRLYRMQDMAKALEMVYRKSPEALKREFEAYLGLFRLDAVLEKRMETLLAAENTDLC